MSTDPSATAIGPDDAVAEELASPAAAPSNDLADLAAAIERLEALIAADAVPGPDGSAAVERIADIAFVLHEREVEASLCDALDAAVREISDSGLLKSASTQRTHEAAELLRDLSRRVNDLTARTLAEEGADPAAAAQAPGSAAESAKFDDADAGTDDEIGEGLFAADLPEDDEFARVVAELAGSLPAPPDQEPASDPPPETSTLTARSSDWTPPSDPPPEETSEALRAESGGVLASVTTVEMTLVIESGDAAMLGEFSSEPSAPPDVAAGEPSAERSSGDVTSAEEFAHEQTPSDLPPVPLSSSIETPMTEAVPNETGSSETLLYETSSSETVSAEELPSAELAVESAASLPSEESASVSALALPVPDVIAHTSLGDSLSPPSAPASAMEAIAPAVPAVPPAAESSVEPLAGHDAVHGDDESAAVMFAPSEPHRQSPVEAVTQPAAITENADEILAPIEPTPVESQLAEFQPVEPKPSRTKLPDIQPAINPDEDPGDLFEPMPGPSTALQAARGEAVMPVAAPPQPSDVAAIVGKTPAPASESEQKLMPGAQAPTGAPDSKVSTPSPAAKSDAKPQAQSAPPRAASVAPPPAPRAAPADPLAPVRALSEEEMIALFS